MKKKIWNTEKPFHCFVWENPYKNSIRSAKFSKTIFFSYISAARQRKFVKTLVPVNSLISSLNVFDVDILSMPLDRLHYVFVSLSS